MFGNNPKRPPEKGDGTILKVQSIFLTLQGEGPYSGYPSLFLRLGGCNLACSFCDTEFESFTEMHISEIMNQILELSTNSSAKLVVITGGEPFRQKIGKICDFLLYENFKVQIETNGTLYNEIPEGTEVVCSPKSTNNKYYGISDYLKKYIIAYKFLVSDDIEGYKDIPDWDFGNAKIYVQAIDEYDDVKNIKNQKLAIDLALKKGYIFSLQMHKVIGVE